MTIGDCMKWIPPWEARYYCIVYAEKNTNWFDFEEAKAILNIKDKKILSHGLTGLEDAGFLISKKDPVDRRKKYFRLIDPNDVIFAYGIRSLSQSEGIMDLFANASKKMDSVIGDSYAAYVHSRYSSPGKIDIYVKKEGRDKWISLLSGKITSVSVDDIMSEKIAKTNVHIHSSLTQEMIDDAIEIDGIKYASPESLAIKGLVEQSEFSLTDSLAILITKRKEIDFKKMLKLAKGENVSRELGVCLEIINFESGRRIFSPGIINGIYSNADFSTKKVFPRKMEESVEYKNISYKWGLRIGLARAFVSKIIMDLIR